MKEHIGIEDYFQWRKSTENKLIRSACFIPSKLTLFLVERLRKSPNSLLWKSTINLIDVFARYILMPITALRMIYRSQRWSLVCTVKALPIFLYATHLPSVRKIREVLKLG